MQLQKHSDELITVIIPMFNASMFIKSCLSSVAIQTHSSLEVIIVDDGSSDDSALICNKFIEKDSRFRLIQTENHGVSSARNTGIVHAAGKYIMFVDSDDQIATDMIDYLYRLLILSDGDVSTCRLQTTIFGSAASSANQDRVLLGSKVLDGAGATTEILYSRNSIINGSFCKLFKCDLLKGLSFNTSLYYAEDLMMNYSVFKIANKVIVGNATKYFYRIHADSVMRKDFSHRRMTGIDACNMILHDALVNGDQRIVNAAMNRLFMESIAIALQIPNDGRFINYRQECATIIRRYRSVVLFDGYSKLAYRVYAAFLCLSVPIGIEIVRKIRIRKGII